MNWDDLRVFLELARQGSLAGAARVLDMDHTTVARRVAGLEAGLGLRLIDRLPRLTMLTAEGHQVAQLASAMEADALGVLRAARGGGTEVKGTVNVSAPPVFASSWIAPRLGGLLAQHQSLCVELTGESRHADLDRREAEIAVRLERPAGEALVVRRAGTMRFAVYAAAGQPLPQTGPGVRFASYGKGLENTPQQAWQRTAFAGCSVVLRSNDLATVAAAVRAGIAAAVLPVYIGDTDPMLQRVPLPEGVQPPPERSIWLAVHDDLRRDAAVRVVLDALAVIVSDPALAGSRGNAAVADHVPYV